MKHKLSAVLDGMIADLRGDVSALLDLASKKAAYIEHLHTHAQTPMLAYDYPIREWAAIAERQQAISCLEEAKRLMQPKLKKSRA